VREVTPRRNTRCPERGCGRPRVELGVADKEGVMPPPELFARIEIESHAVRCLDRDEMAPFRPRLEIEDIGEELGTRLSFAGMIV